MFKILDHLEPWTTKITSVKLGSEQNDTSPKNQKTMQKPLSIPEGYRELSERKAAELAGVSRSTFRRKHLDAASPEPISLQTKRDGSRYIPFDEVYRLYGEEVLKAIKMMELEPKDQLNHGSKTTYEQSDTSLKNRLNQGEPTNLRVSVQEYVELKAGVASLSVELAQMRERLKDQAVMLEEAKARERYERLRAEKIFDELQASRRLLEDKKLNNQMVDLSPTEVLSPQLSPEQPKSLWKKLFGR